MAKSPSSDPTPVDPDQAAPQTPPNGSPEKEEQAIPAALKSVSFLAFAGLSLLAAGLLIGLVVQTRKLSVRDHMLSNQVNRSEQIQAGLVQMKAKIVEDKTDTDRLREKLNDSLKNQEAMVQEKDKLATSSATTQRLLDNARQDSTKFQTATAAAKVASLEQQGIAEIARTEADVLRMQLKQATTTIIEVQKDLDKSKTEVETVRGSLKDAEALIANLQKPAGHR